MLVEGEVEVGERGAGGSTHGKAEYLFEEMGAEGEVGIVDCEEKNGFEGLQVEAIVVEETSEAGDDG